MDILLKLKSHFTNVPLMALTATAIPALHDQLLALLRNPVKEISTINKPNISFHAMELTDLPKHG
jgi:superfamily II DNA helicase RecQ